MAKKKVLKKQKPSAKQLAKKKASHKPVSKKTLVKKVKARKAGSKKAAVKKTSATTAAKKATKVVTKVAASESAKTAKVSKAATAKVPQAAKPASASKKPATDKANASKPVAPAAVVAKPVVVATPQVSGPKDAARTVGGHRVVSIRRPSVSGSGARSTPDLVHPIPDRPLVIRPKAPMAANSKAVPPTTNKLSVASPATSGKVTAKANVRGSTPRPRVVGTGPVAMPGQGPRVLIRPAGGKVQAGSPISGRGIRPKTHSDSVVVFKRKPGSKLGAEELRRVLRELEFVTIRHSHPRSRSGTSHPVTAHAPLRPGAPVDHALDALVRIPPPPPHREFLPVDKQLEVLTRGAVELYSLPELRHKLEHSRKTGRPLRVKLGLDPSRPDIHIGHSVVLRKLRQFQQLGHQPVVIIGDYTAMVGDPSGKSKTRPTLTEQEVLEAARTYFDQISTILDTKNLEVRRNGEWFGRMSFSEVMKLAGQVTVARVLERDDFSKRYESQAPISLHEFFYPLMQGHDSVEVHADVELGGTDQTFNLLMGRKLQEDAGMMPQVCLTTPLIPGLDGVEKMSKSLGNAIAVRESPDDMFGKTMSIPDALMRSWFENLTDLSEVEITRLCTPTITNPRNAKDRLAQEIVAAFHSREAAKAASEEFVRRFRERELPADMPVHSRSKATMSYENLLLETRLASSTSEVRRLMGQSGFRVIMPGGTIAEAAVRTDPKELCNLPSGTILMAGKRRFVRLT